MKNDKEVYYQSNLMEEKPEPTANEQDALGTSHATTLHYETGLKGKLNTAQNLRIDTNLLKTKFVIRVKAYTANGYIGYAEKEFWTQEPVSGR